MANIHIDPELGHNAAMNVSDEELQYLCNLILWELALRTDEHQFEECLRNTLENRRNSSDRLQAVRQERDMMAFAAQVMMDIQRLPATDDHRSEPNTGHYL